MTQTLRVVTSHLFRCHGLQTIPSDADRFGAHDLAWWIVFLAVISGWFLFIFAPQSERLGMLKDRHTVLCSQLKENTKELQRLRRGISDLAGGDANAWERAARGRLGWLEPGELTDVVAWNQMRVSMEKPVAAPGNTLKPNNLLPRMLPRPHIPALPVPPAAQGTPRLLVSADSLTTDKIGPCVGCPPRPPVARAPMPIAPAAHVAPAPSRVLPVVAAYEVRNRTRN